MNPHFHPRDIFGRILICASILCFILGILFFFAYFHRADLKFNDQGTAYWKGMIIQQESVGFYKRLSFTLTLSAPVILIIGRWILSKARSKTLSN